ncbi:hypothetical protein BFF78_24255 [Streptomyces fodineus]|uniref:Uncharacterized protein n=1 Tax=Streptomyces fodineus TaxID=1904616 RepID=A0A1D7YEJ1_9ACTN|nr:DUF5819 family protein [Streptomyces fodineus]AOR33759.1 hypothetical protein BFF78_24255 [Streptomyces fodineus]
MTERVVVRRAVLVSGAALLGAYLATAALTQAPLNPVKLRYYNEIHSVTEPYLSQNWMLFAPDPLSDDRGILARAKCGNGRLTGFYDVTRPYVDRVQRDRFFPSRINRLVSGTITQMDTPDPVLERLRDKEVEKKKRPVPLLPDEKASRNKAEIFLARYSLSQLPKVCDGAAPSAVQVRMYVHELPSWSQRKDSSAKGRTSFEDLKWRNTEAVG